jgi:hypothetical protein
MALAPPGAASPEIAREPDLDRATARRRRLRVDPLELLVLLLFAAVSSWVLALDLYQVIAHGRVWTGTDGLFIADQMQYLAWIRDASHHLLASDLFVINQTPHDYIQPVVAISGGLTALGVAPWLSLLLWKPVAVVGAFLGLRAYVRRMVWGGYAQLAAMVLALFYGWFGSLGDAWLPFWSWGYPFGLMAIAAMVAGLVAYTRARQRGTGMWQAPVLGLLAAWLHPWQGETLILVVLGGELIAVAARSDQEEGRIAVRRRLLLCAGTVLATALPLIYYGILDRADLVWRLGRIGTSNGWGFGGVMESLIPLFVVAALSYRRRPRSFLAAATMAWPLAALAVYGISIAGLGATPLHAFAGITIPLAVLTVRGLQSLPLARLPYRRLAALAAVALVAVTTIPAAVDQLSSAHIFMGPYKNDGNFIRRDEQRALSFLARDPQPGGVLTPFYLGMVVPAITGRHTYIGDFLWSVPNYKQRFTQTFNLFKWPETNSAAWAFVRSTGARFVLTDCHGHAGGLVKKLTPISRAVYPFGCATVLQLY